ncbi:uncharacterized protein LOC117182718 [Belonocnema kinseyi]|uniref:uncharacterized protein LOC117182718 n=1 Tax=Belonocnema kinseyi TaxID=2817044 RepID=UPI00143D1FAC|nr:uncharacterized protein LOC117182718 [Belonocnema kinseyi]
MSTSVHADHGNLRHGPEFFLIHTNLVLRRKRRKIPREAIAINPAAGKKYADVLKEVQANVKPDDHGVSVKSIRQTRTGDVLIELKAKKEDRERFGTALSGALGDSGGVRHLVPRAKIVLYDLVETTEVVDVEEALRAVLGERIGAPPKINLTKRNNRGCVLAFVELDAVPARKLEVTGRLKIGWLYCRVKAHNAVIRCYRCHNPGHIARECTGEDCSGNCHRCGLEGHKAAQCREKVAFRPPPTAKRKP